MGAPPYTQVPISSSAFDKSCICPERYGEETTDRKSRCRNLRLCEREGKGELKRESVSLTAKLRDDVDSLTDAEVYSKTLRLAELCCCLKDGKRRHEIAEKMRVQLARPARPLPRVNRRDQTAQPDVLRDDVLTTTSTNRGRTMRATASPNEPRSNTRPADVLDEASNSSRHIPPAHQRPPSFAVLRSRTDASPRIAHTADASSRTASRSVTPQAARTPAPPTRTSITTARTTVRQVAGTTASHESSSVTMSSDSRTHRNDATPLTLAVKVAKLEGLTIRLRQERDDARRECNEASNKYAALEKTCYDLANVVEEGESEESGTRTRSKKYTRLHNAARRVAEALAIMEAEGDDSEESEDAEATNSDD